MVACDARKDQRDMGYEKGCFMTATVTKDSMRDVLHSIQTLVGQKVLIGIPQETDAREGPINNASIGYLMENGSPANNVPARPFLVPGVDKALPACTKLLKKGASGALDGNKTAVEHALEKAGIVATSAVKAMIVSNIGPALKPSTIRGRKYARGTKSRRANETEYLAKVKSGTDPASAQSSAGIVALVNTGQLLNSITHVVRKAK